ncbi:hypothetical protein BC830DRAFT_1167635 [Chytriomyces sp. MP71]|nr:hypothetical protein BC830DRAFT_1167635 [Chytriomyces sp. MP71]
MKNGEEEGQSSSYAESLAILTSFAVAWSADPGASEVAYRQSGFVRTQASVFPAPLLRDFACNTLASSLRAAFEARHSQKTHATLSVGARALCKHYERRAPFFATPATHTAELQLTPVASLMNEQDPDAGEKEEKERKENKQGNHPYWTRPTGSDANKNAIALAHLNHLLQLFASTNPQVCWKNIHLIHPNNTCIIEVREYSTLYGMRWTVLFDGTIKGESEGESESDVTQDFDSSYRLEFRGFLEP